MGNIREAGSNRLDFVFISSNLEWGGSEDLWSETALRLARAGHGVRYYKNTLPLRGKALRDLSAVARGIELAKIPLFPTGYYWPTRTFARPLDIGISTIRLYASLRLRKRPHLAIVSQGGNHDGWPLAAACRRLSIPYVILSHKATDHYWPSDSWRTNIDNVYADARHCFFVSEHSWKLTQEQLGRELPNASIIRNPVRVLRDAIGGAPSDGDVLRLACVGRLSPQEKGQDILLRVLALPKWRSRPLQVTFFGDGDQRRGLETMARYLRLSSVAFAGQVDDVAGIWESHHALILPSRAEGLPLTIVEAMLCGRLPIVTDVGGNREIVSDEVTGFIAASATETELDATLERAWQKRDRWPAMGIAAAQAIRTKVPDDPAQAFADNLIGIVTRDRREVRINRSKK